MSLLGCHSASCRVSSKSLTHFLSERAMDYDASVLHITTSALPPASPTDTSEATDCMDFMKSNALLELEPAKPRVFRELSVEEKRERNRITVKRFYHRKIRILQELRDEATRLDKKYQSLVSQLQDRYGGDPTLMKSQHASGMPRLYRRYMETCRLREALSSENDSLNNMLLRKMKICRKLTRVLEVELNVIPEIDDMAPVDEVIAYECSCVTAQRPLLSAAECKAFLQAGLEKLQSVAPRDSTDVTNILGWNYHQAISQSRDLCFGASKLYAGELVDDLAYRGWLALTSPSLFANRLPGLPGFTSNAHVVQEVDARNVIMCASTPTPSATYQLFFLVSWLPISATHHIIVCNSLPVDRAEAHHCHQNEPSDTPIVQIPFTTWCTITSDPNDYVSTHVSFEGCVPKFASKNTAARGFCSPHQMMFDLTHMFMRWESDALATIRL